MGNMEMCWAVVSYITGVMNLIVEGWLFYCFVRPFLNKNKYAGMVGVSYFFVMFLLYVVPFVIEYPRIFGAAAAFLVMCLIDRSNMTQKIFLVIVMYLLQWIAQGVVLLPRSIMFAFFINTSYMMTRTMLQFMVYILVEVWNCILRGFFLYLMVTGIQRVYVGKKETITGKELLMLLSMLLTMLTGYVAFTFFSDVYVHDTGQYIWNVHGEYNLLKILYQIVSLSAVFVVIVVYQRIKEKQREEKENAVLAEQIESMKSHIREVEKLYRDMRGLKHDMGTHMMILQNLLVKNERDAFETYFKELKITWSGNVREIKTGNPITDVILTEKQKEAKEKGIDFICEFFYPAETKVGAFDVSVILNNAIANAMEAAEGCQNPYISVSSYRKKNVYMIEVKNCIKNCVEIDEETGLPETSKQDKENHGFGLINIRKVARKYYGDIDMEQDGNTFLLSVMLMVE